MIGVAAGAAALATAGTLVLGLSVLGGVDEPGAAAAAAAQLKAGAVPDAYVELVLAAGDTCDAVTAPLLAAQLDAESGFDPRAVSPAGAQGIAQFMPGTWAAYGQDENGDGAADPFEPADAIPAQARYDCALAEQLAPALAARQLVGDPTELMLAAYNAGPGAVLAARGIPQNGETPTYVARIVALAATYAEVGATAGTDFGDRVAATALKWLGSPYVWGGGGPAGPTSAGSTAVGFDCSGLVIHAVYQASGGRMLLPHLADQQGRLGRSVTRSDLRRGDVIAFAAPRASRYHHIGIYLGEGLMVHAPDFGQTVETTSLAAAYWTTLAWSTRRYG